MNYHLSRLSSLTVAIMLVSSCSQQDQDPRLDVTNKNAVQDQEELPINIVIKREPASKSHNAPIADVPVPVGGAVQPIVPPPAAPLPPFPPVLPPPFLPIDDSCEEEFCGNGIKEHGEDCDDGDDNNDDDCDNFCRKPECGNGVIEGEEECDNPDHVGCTEDCTLPLCGNGEVDEDETCDPPNAETCNSNCLLSVCGNGIVELGEECDDDNDVVDDGCNNACELNCTPPVAASPHKRP